MLELMFYDGHCGLCHGVVRFVLARDREGAVFRFAPLQGSTLRASVPEAQRALLPDSIAVLTEDARLLTRSAAVVHILKRLGRGWRVVGALLSMVPRPLRDWGYDWVARIRHRLFSKPPDVCPVVPPDRRNRFAP